MTHTHDWHYRERDDMGFQAQWWECGVCGDEEPWDDITPPRREVSDPTNYGGYRARHRKQYRTGARFVWWCLIMVVCTALTLVLYPPAPWYIYVAWLSLVGGLVLVMDRGGWEKKDG